MKIITLPECKNWLKTNIGAESTEEIGAKYVNSISYVLPGDTGKKTALGRALVASLNTKSSGLFWIVDTGIWSSSENMELFDGYRKSLGERRPVNLAPAHAFGEDDLRQLECLIDLTLYFYWDSILVESGGGTLIRTSHDEYISFCATNRDRLLEIESAILALELKPLTRA